MPYRCRKNFRYGKKPYKIDQAFNADSSTLTDMLKRGLLYETKEDKRAYNKADKIHIEKDETTKTMYYVKKGNQIIDRMTKSKAVKLMDELNGLA
jgi:hypothetical protein